MTDSDVVKGDDVKLRVAVWQKLSRAIAREWFNTGYDWRAHWNGMIASGDIAVMKKFYDSEVLNPGPHTLARAMARWDVHETARIIHARRQQNVEL